MKARAAFVCFLRSKPRTAGDCLAPLVRIHGRGSAQRHPCLPPVKAENSELTAGCSLLTGPVHHVSSSSNIFTLAHEPISGVITSETGASNSRMFMLKCATHLFK